MRKIIVLNLFGMLLLCASCGGAKTPSIINGLWDATLQNSNVAGALGFTAQLTQNTGTSVAVSNLVFSPSDSCFPSQTVESATFSAVGNSSGRFGMTITTQGSETNVLTIQGNLMSNSGNQSITGTWVLTGTTGCSGGGTVVMIPLPPV